jgi:hypothetical protein
MLSTPEVEPELRFSALLNLVTPNSWTSIGLNNPAQGIRQKSGEAFLTIQETLYPLVVPEGAVLAFKMTSMVPIRKVQTVTITLSTEQMVQCSPSDCARPNIDYVPATLNALWTAASEQIATGQLSDNTLTIQTRPNPSTQTTRTFFLTPSNPNSTPSVDFSTSTFDKKVVIIENNDAPPVVTAYNCDAPLSWTEKPGSLSQDLAGLLLPWDVWTTNDEYYHQVTIDVSNCFEDPNSDIVKWTAKRPEWTTKEIPVTNQGQITVGVNELDWGASEIEVILDVVATDQLGFSSSPLRITIGLQYLEFPLTQIASTNMYFRPYDYAGIVVSKVISEYFDVSTCFRVDLTGARPVMKGTQQCCTTFGDSVQLDSCFLGNLRPPYAISQLQLFFKILMPGRTTLCAGNMNADPSKQCFAVVSTDYLEIEAIPHQYVGSVVNGDWSIEVPILSTNTAIPLDAQIFADSGTGITSSYDSTTGIMTVRGTGAVSPTTYDVAAVVKHASGLVTYGSSSSGTTFRITAFP